MKSIKHILHTMLLFAAYALLCVSKAYALKVHVQIEPDMVLVDNEYGYIVTIQYYDFDGGPSVTGDYTVNITLWNDPTFTAPFNLLANQTQLKPVGCIQKVKDLRQPIKQFVPREALRRNTMAYAPKTFTSTVYWKIALKSPYKYQDIVIRGSSKGLEMAYIKAKTTILENIDWGFDTEAYKESTVKKYADEDFEAGDFSGNIIGVSYLPPNLSFNEEGKVPFIVRLNMYHDAKRTRPCMFYEYLDEKDSKGHPRIFYAKGQFDDRAWEEERVAERTHMVNYISRKRSDWSPFGIFVPNDIISFADKHYDAEGTPIDDSLYIYADIYDMEGNLMSRGNHYTYFSRLTPKEEHGCYHRNTDEYVVVTKRERISDNMVVETYNIIKKCKDCGKDLSQYGLTRTVEDKDQSKAQCPPHAWESDRCEADYNSIKRTKSKDGCQEEETIIYNISHTCIRCNYKENVGKDTVTTIKSLISETKCSDCEDERIITEETYGDPIQKNGGTIQPKTISLYRLCENPSRKELLEQYTEWEWLEQPCPPHNWVLSKKEEVGAIDKTSFYHIAQYLNIYQCSKCGLTEVRPSEENHKHEMSKVFKECSNVGSWKAHFNGISLNFHLAANETDSSAVYVAETETTQALWAAIYPNNAKGWTTKSKFPATGLSYNDVLCFISELNHKAEVESWPLRFRLPSTDEWLMAYKCGGGDKEAWEATTKRPVAELAHNKIGVYDMRGNVAEMCADTTSIMMYGDKKTMYAAMGSCYNSMDDCPTSEHWYAADEPQDHVGFRIFADPVNGDESKIDLIEVDGIGEKDFTIGHKWLVRNAFQCKKCGRLEYGLRHTYLVRGNNKPVFCK